MDDEEFTEFDDHPAGGKGYVGFIDWLNRKLYSTWGPPPVGPYGPVVERLGEAACPVCGRPMSEHTFDRTAHDTILNCPAAHLPRPFNGNPVNELGMDKPAAGS
ncbi:MAG: hypothetical protein ACOH10_08185 [Rhodoglobus sp.]